MAELYDDVKSTGVYNSGHLLENDFQSKTPWATPGNDTNPGSNASRRKKNYDMNILRRKGGGRKRMR